MDEKAFKWRQGIASWFPYEVRWEAMLKNRWWGVFERRVCGLGNASIGCVSIFVGLHFPVA